MKRVLYIKAILCVLLFTCVQAQDQWSLNNSSSGPGDLLAHKMAYIGDDHVLLFGGIDGSPNQSSETWLYDRSLNTWTQRVPLTGSPSPRASHAMAYIGGDKVVLFGGMSFNSTATSEYCDTWVYDLSDNTWTNMAPLFPPGTRSEAAVAYIGCGRAVLYGGTTTVGPVSDTTWIYNLDRNTWTPRIQDTTPGLCHAHSMATIGNGKVLLYGGWTMGPTGGTWVYDPAQDTWTEKITTSKPLDGVYASMASLNGDRVMLFGGWDQVMEVYPPTTNLYPTHITWIYDESDNAWTISPVMTHPWKCVHHALAGTGTGEVLLFGGAVDDRSEMSDSTWLFSPDTPVTVGFTDNTTPVISGPPNIVVDSDPGLCSAMVSFERYTGTYSIYGTAWNAGTIYKMDRNTLGVQSLIPMNITGISSSILSTHGLARHPVTGIFYAVVGHIVAQANVRSLVCVDPETGNGVLIGGSAINVSGIAFDNAGILYAIGGSNGPGANQLHTLNLTTGAATAVMSLPSGGGKSLAYNYDDGLLYYKWHSGFAKINPGTATLTNIPLIATGVDEYVIDEYVAGLYYRGNGKFYINNWDWYQLTTSGAWTRLTAGPDWMKGLAGQNPVAIRANDNCDLTLVQTAGLAGGSRFPLGTTTNTFVATDASDNVSVYSFTVTVLGSPPSAAVTSSPAVPVDPGGQPNTIYPGFGAQSVVLTASEGESYSWYPPTGLSCTTCANPTASPAITTTYTVTVTNQNGCSAIASITILVVDVRCGSNPDKVLVCHQCQNIHTVCIDASAVQTHLNHGDYLGDCIHSPKTLPEAKSFAYAESYPNPFTHSTQITYAITENARVRLTVFDVHGRIVAVLADESQFSGSYTVYFEAGMLPDGVYLYRLQANNDIRTGIMMHMR